MSIINANSPSLTATEREVENLIQVRHPATIPTRLTDAWVRNPLWIEMPTFSLGEQKFAGLFMVSNDDSNYVTMQAAGNYTIDWGDGVVENYSSGVISYHKYDYDAISNSTYVDEGDYKTVLVIVTPQAGQNLTSISLHNLHNVAGYPTPNSSGPMANPWLDIAFNTPNLTSFRLTTDTAGNIPGNFTALLEHIYIGQTILSNVQFLFDKCYNLRSIELPFSSSWTGTSLTGTFRDCTKLVFAPSINQNITSLNNTFNGCFNLMYVPLYNTQNCTDFTNAFSNCYALRELPFFNTGNVTSFSSAFLNCYNLRIIPPFNLSRCTTVASMFQNCYVLESVPYFETGNITNFTSMFNGCRLVSTVPTYNTANAVLMTSMFNGCTTLESVPRFNTIRNGDFSSMFNGCSLLTVVPDLNTRNGNNFSSMFLNCYVLNRAPNFNMVKAVNITSMFQNCKTIRAVPNYNTQNVTTTSSMFSGCYMLRSAPNIITSNVTVMQNMFNDCRLLNSVPNYDTRNVTNMSAMFATCLSLREIPKFDYNRVTTIASMFSGCTGLERVPDYNQETRNLTTMTDCFYRNISLREISNLFIGNINSIQTTAFGTPYELSSLTKLSLVGNANVSFACNATLLSANVISNVLNTVCGNVTTSMGYPYVSFRGNWGANATTFSRSVTRTANSNIMTITGGTANLTSNMTILGAGSPLTVPIAVTFTTGTSYVSKSSGADHEFANNTRVAFHNIVTTTGISSNVIYYTSSVDNKNFQIATTPGGVPITFTNNGTGRMRYETKIVSIVTNISVQFDNAVTTEHAGTGNVAFTSIDVTKASLNGWNVILL